MTHLVRPGSNAIAVGNNGWIATTTDGTQYYFGLDDLPGQSSATNSTLTVPVFGNHSGEPCHTTAFTSSDCVQAWRWNLDHVVDPHARPGRTDPRLPDRELVSALATQT